MSSLPRWNELFSRVSSNDCSGTQQIYVNECYACTQVGVPIFHSTQLPTTDPHCRTHGSNRRQSGPLGRIVDPRSSKIKRWNRVVLLARGLALAVDPVFFYVLSLSGGVEPCFYMDVPLAVAVTVVRTILDGLHFWYLWLQFRLAYVSSESLVVGCGKLVWDPREIVCHYLRSFKGFWLDAFVILPIPQVVIWVVVPKFLEEQRTKYIGPTLLVTYLLQFFPNVYHNIYLMRQLQKVTGYVFGSVWWRFNLNVFAYMIASHVLGACWYILSTNRFMGCLKQQCEIRKQCDLSTYCSHEKWYIANAENVFGKTLSGGNDLTKIRLKCSDENFPFDYGIYQPIVLVFQSNSLAVKLLYPIYWGLLNLSSFGNVLTPTSNWLELIFCCIITLSGLALFVTLIGNIQVFLHVVMANKKKTQLKHRDMEWWMRRRQLPSHLRERVRHFQRHSWAAMGGQDEMELIQDLPDGIRRDIKRYICLDLVKKVPLFDLLDDLILDNICDRVRPIIYCKGEKVVREGDPIQRMVFMVRGRVKRSQGLAKGFPATSVLEPGGFFGDELLTWCLRRPFVDRLPASSATFTCIEELEAFVIEADHLQYIIHHFRYNFASERLKRTARYYSSNWRTWGAVIIQLAWRRYWLQTRGIVSDSMQNGEARSRLRQYATFFLSLRPHDHLE